MEEVRIPVALKILQYPYRRRYNLDTIPDFYGLLCVCEYNDGTTSFIDDPWVEIPDYDIPGTYKGKVYLDKAHSFGLYTTFKFSVNPIGSDIKR